MAERIRGKTFEIVPRELAPAYKWIKSKVEPELSELRTLAEKEELSTEEKKRVKPLLGDLSSKIIKACDFYYGMTDAIEDQGREGLKRKLARFGHAPPDLEGSKWLHECAANAISQAMVLSTLSEKTGDQTGVFTLPDHTAPAIKIAGRTYILDKAGVFTVQEYAKKLKEEGVPGKLGYHGGWKASLGAAHLNLGGTYYKLRSYDLALKHFLIAGKLNPNLSPSHAKVAAVLIRMNREEEAFPHLVQAVAHNPLDSIALLNLTIVLSRMKKPEEAIARVEKAVENNPKAEGLKTLLAQIKELRRVKTMKSPYVPHEDRRMDRQKK